MKSVTAVCVVEYIKMVSYGFGVMVIVYHALCVGVDERMYLTAILTSVLQPF